MRERNGLEKAWGPLGWHNWPEALVVRAKEVAIEVGREPGLGVVLLWPLTEPPNLFLQVVPL